MTDNQNPEDVPQPDPGNSPPENWTEPMSPEEVQEAKDRLAEGAKTNPDFIVVDGVPQPYESVVKDTQPEPQQEQVTEFSEKNAAPSKPQLTTEFIEPTPAESQEADADDGSSSSSN